MTGASGTPSTKITPKEWLKAFDVKTFINKKVDDSFGKPGFQGVDKVDHPPVPNKCPMPMMDLAAFSQGKTQWHWCNADPPDQKTLCDVHETIRTKWKKEVIQKMVDNLKEMAFATNRQNTEDIDFTILTTQFHELLTEALSQGQTALSTAAPTAEPDCIKALSAAMASMTKMQQQVKNNKNAAQSVVGAQSTGGSGSSGTSPSVTPTVVSTGASAAPAGPGVIDDDDDGQLSIPPAPPLLKNDSTLQDIQEAYKINHITTINQLKQLYKTPDNKYEHFVENNEKLRFVNDKNLFSDIPDDEDEREAYDLVVKQLLDDSFQINNKWEVDHYLSINTAITKQIKENDKLEKLFTRFTNVQLKWACIVKYVNL